MPPLPTDCQSTTNTAADCNECCTSQADNVAGLFGEPELAGQIAAYRQECALGCFDANLQRAQKVGQQKGADACLAAALGANSGAAEAQNVCPQPGQGDPEEGSSGAAAP